MLLLAAGEFDVKLQDGFNLADTFIIVEGWNKKKESFPDFIIWETNSQIPVNELCKRFKKTLKKKGALCVT